MNPIYSEDNPKVIHDGRPDDGGIARCGKDYNHSDGHGWLETNDPDVIEFYGNKPTRKLCKDCFVGDIIRVFEE